MEDFSEPLLQCIEKYLLENLGKCLLKDLKENLLELTLDSSVEQDLEIICSITNTCWKTLNSWVERARRLLRWGAVCTSSPSSRPPRRITVCRASCLSLCVLLSLNIPACNHACQSLYHLRLCVLVLLNIPACSHACQGLCILHCVSCCQ